MTSKRQKPLTGEISAETEPTTGTTPLVSPSSSSSPVENGPGAAGIMQLPEEALQHILRFVSFAQVKSARLVNKDWRKATTFPLRRLSKGIEVDHSILECITEMGDGQFPVYRLEVIMGKENDPEKINRCSHFPAICAWVKELTLEMDINKQSQIRMDMGSFPRDCIYEELTHFNLEVVPRTVSTPEFWKGFIDFVHSILAKSPNLREVKVTSYCGIEVPTIPLLEDLFSNSSSVWCSKLSSVDFLTVPLEKIGLAKWCTLNHLKLKKLGMPLSRSSDLNDLLARFLETQSGTLKKLTLSLNRCDSKPPAVTFQFPRMEKLEQLGFICRSIKVTKVTFPGIDYARLFPGLKKLDLEEDGVDWRDFVGNTLEPSNTVEEIIFPSTFGKVEDPTPDPVLAAARVFPALRKLTICGDRVFVAAVYENMPNLEVLTLRKCCGTFDKVITGLVESELFNGVMTDMWINALNSAEERSISRLQNLRTLKLRPSATSTDRDSVRLSWLSLHVLKKIGSLKCVDLANGNIERVKSCLDEKGKQFVEELQENFLVL